MNHTDIIFRSMNTLPNELKREIIKFIPRNDTAQIIYDSRHLLSLKYVRRFVFDNSVYEDRIWNELKPVQLRSIFYGDTQKITRTNISRGQHVHLRHMNVL